MGIHTGTATIARGSPITLEMLDDYRAGSFGERLTATLAFLERHQRDPNGLSVADVDVVRAAGVSDAAIEDALHVAFVFNLINRLADAFGFSFGDEDGRQAEARALHRIGYRMPGFLVS
jgi:alkylhydroperoxidase family enzyme